MGDPETGPPVGEAGGCLGSVEAQPRVHVLESRVHVLGSTMLTERSAQNDILFNLDGSEASVFCPQWQEVMVALSVESVERAELDAEREQGARGLL